MKKTFTRFLTHCKDDGIFQRSCLMITFLLNTAIARAHNYIVTGQLKGERSRALPWEKILVASVSNNVMTRMKNTLPAFL